MLTVIACYEASDRVMALYCDDLRLLDVLEDLVELLELGHDHSLAVALLGVLVEVVLMVLLCRIKFGEGNDLGGDFAVEDIPIEFLFEFFGCLFLIFVLVEDRRTVLRSFVVALFVQCGRVVGLPVDFEKCPKGDFIGVEFDLDDLGVSRFACADLFVGRVDDGTTRVPGDDGTHPFDSLKNSFGTPEAAASEGCLFQFLVLFRWGWIGCGRSALQSRLTMCWRDHG